MCTSAADGDFWFGFSHNFPLSSFDHHWNTLTMSTPVSTCRSLRIPKATSKAKSAIPAAKKKVWVFESDFLFCETLLKSFYHGTIAYILIIILIFAFFPLGSGSRKLQILRRSISESSGWLLLWYGVRLIVYLSFLFPSHFVCAFVQYLIELPLLPFVQSFIKLDSFPWEECSIYIERCRVRGIWLIYFILFHRLFFFRVFASWLVGGRIWVDSLG